MKSKISALLVFVLFVSASITNSLPQTKNTIENVFTLELSFGDDNLPSEYLLARPGYIAVNNNGDIYVSDENRIKVYTKDGKPKLIIGRPGQGPNEFSGTPNIVISPAGFITAKASGSQSSIYYTFYTPDNKFIETKLFDREPYLLKIEPQLQYTSIGNNLTQVLLATNEKIFYGLLTIHKENEIIGKSYDVLAYEKSGIFKTLIKQEHISTAVARYKGSVSHLSYFGYDMGQLEFCLLPDNKLVYTNTAFDRRIEKGKGWYKLHIVSLQTSEQIDFEIEYVPVKMEKSVIEFRQDYNSIKNEKSAVTFKAVDDIMIKRAKAQIYDATFSYMINDGYYVLTAKQFRKDTTRTIECIDLKTGKKVFSTTFAGNQRTEETTLRDGRKITEKFVDFLVTYNSIIKNGYLYKIKSGPNIYPVVEKYRIDPKVYGK
jgi:hypothetical protein